MARLAAAACWTAAWFVAAFPWTPPEMDAGGVFLALVTVLYVAHTVSKSGGLSLRPLPDAPEGRPPRLKPRQRTLLALVVVLPPVGEPLAGALPDNWFNEISAVRQDLLRAVGVGVLGGLALGASLLTLRALHCRWSEWRNGDEIVRVSLRYKSWLASRPARAGARSEADTAFGR